MTQWGLKVKLVSGRTEMYSLHPAYLVKPRGGHEKCDKDYATCFYCRLVYFDDKPVFRFHDHQDRLVMLIKTTCESIQVVPITIQPKPSNPLTDENFYDDPLR